MQRLVGVLVLLLASPMGCYSMQALQQLSSTSTSCQSCRHGRECFVCIREHSSRCTKVVACLVTVDLPPQVLLLVVVVRLLLVVVVLLLLLLQPTKAQRMQLCSCVHRQLQQAWLQQLHT